ncbi:hypothetical protein FS763_01355 [Agrobacterium vitis]|uniref:hypothetical protein n=1 Tax=Allorhizobium ampelinum TaxID=3025782 RepID=UPI001F3451D7|nr:hypothetical protein [Allorhizobium ampelinum]MCF1470577.1 hypothetical protein [Allorhizobium ampelinum]
MTATDDDCTKQIKELRHAILRNALYHIARRSWHERVNRFLNLGVIIGGTVYVAKIWPGSPGWDLALGLATSTIGAMQLVFDFGGKARDHQMLQKRYYDIRAAIDGNTAPMTADCAKWRAELTRIYADEPPTFRALDAIADNQATAALHDAVKPRLKVNLWQSLTRNIFVHNGGEFPIQPGWKAESLSADENKAG